MRSKQIGIFRARDKAKAADLVLWLSEACAPVPPGVQGGEVWPVFTKCDLLLPDERQSLPQGLYISAESGKNLDCSLKSMEDFARAAVSGGHAGLIARERHRKAFETAAFARALDRVWTIPERPSRIAGGGLARGDGFAAKTDRRGGRRGYFGRDFRDFVSGSEHGPKCFT